MGSRAARAMRCSRHVLLPPASILGLLPLPAGIVTGMVAETAKARTRGKARTVFKCIFMDSSVVFADDLPTQPTTYVLSV
ncbi:hypothetical protein EI94DRAFT_1722693 [Lactarius quietus]|nr:hypothetical protein EI94DRAFT_1722693 [Lactarius quietus]